MSCRFTAEYTIRELTRDGSSEDKIKMAVNNVMVLFDRLYLDGRRGGGGLISGTWRLRGVIAGK